MAGRTCAVVLVGCETANRKWVKYEILKAWNDGLGVVGIRVHKLLDQESRPSVAGENPFYMDNKLARLVPIKDPAGNDSKAVYATIANNIESWIEEAIKIRSNSKP
jgi:Thoeris protein ThsB, TIR-like domain